MGLVAREDALENDDCGRWKEVPDKLRPGGGGITGDMLGVALGVELALLLPKALAALSGEEDNAFL